MSNTPNGNGFDDDDTTPTPTTAHLKPLEINRPYIKALGEAIPVLSAVLTTLSELLHEIRLARAPLGPGTLTRIDRAGKGLEKTGQIVRRGFRSGG